MVTLFWGGLAAVIAWTAFVYLSPFKTCGKCGGKGRKCSRCRRTGKVRRFGSSVVHRAVLSIRRARAKGRL